jgi:hypothetical protein
MTTPTETHEEEPRWQRLAMSAYFVAFSWIEHVVETIHPCRDHRGCLLPRGHSGKCIPAKATR